MLQPTALTQLRDAYLPNTSVSPDVVLAQLGNPTEDEIVAAALAAMNDTDRNVRVMALRILHRHPGEDSLPGILQGLTDPERRVREVAVESSKQFLAFPAVLQPLVAIIHDEDEKPKLRQRALTALTGGGSPILRGPLPQPAANEVRALMDNAAYRSQILLALVQLDLSAPVEALLQEFVRNGSASEVAMATKALVGHRVVNLGRFDDATRKAMQRDGDLAAERVFYWIDRQEFTTKE